MAARDVVVVGSGHNALVAACYLARGGLDVEVVERDAVLGGAVSTVERWPGYAVDRGSSAHIMVRHTGIVEDLRLAECGLTYLDMDPWGFAPFGDAEAGEQQALTFHVSLDATCDSIAALCGDRDAEAYRAFVTDWAGRNEAVFAAFQDLPTAGRLGRHLWGAGKASSVGGLEMSRQFLQPADQLLDEHFGDERLKTALAWLGAQSGPPTHEVATADLVGWGALLHSRAPGRAVGGSGALTVALAERLRRLGGTVRLGDGAAAITRSGDRVTGVTTDSGEHLAARAVVAGCHVLTTLELLGDEALLARATTAVRVGNGIGMVVRLGTTALPAYPAMAGAPAYGAMQLLAPSRTHLRAAYGVPDVLEPGQRPEPRRAMVSLVVVHGLVVAEPGVAGVGIGKERRVQWVEDGHPSQPPRRSSPSVISAALPAKENRTNSLPLLVSKSMPGAVATPVSSSRRRHQAWESWVRWPMSAYA